MADLSKAEVAIKVEGFSNELDYNLHEVAVILAAGHGKRIKSHRSKMLHDIWGVPTVERVYNACTSTDSAMNVVTVVGIKAETVIDKMGKRDKLSFAYQSEQKGTGHAVQVALEKIDSKKFTGTVYVLPGDMGLIDTATISMFREKFSDSESDMMVLTGIYEGDVNLNSYGRIIRVKDVDVAGIGSGEDFNKVIEILEYKDILALSNDKAYTTSYKGRYYSYTRQELIENREFNSGVYAFDYGKLIELVFNITSNNAQNEIYITDLIALFNQKGYEVNAVSPKEEYVVMGFNDKSVLKEMETLYRRQVYSKLRNIIEIDDPDDFFIDEKIVEQILEMDSKGTPLDIRVGKGCYIGKGVKLNYNASLLKNAFIKGNVELGMNVTIWENVHLSCFENQTLKVGDNVQILSGNIVKGNIIIGDESRIESSVNLTGSDEHPLVIGKNVLIKGTSYIYGSEIEDDVQILHSVIINKRVIRQVKRDGTIQPVMYYLPMPTGVDIVEDK